MKGMMVSLLISFCATGMVVAQQTASPSSAQSVNQPISYELPVDSSILDGIKREGWRKAEVEPKVRGWIHEIVFRDPLSRSTSPPAILERSDGIRDRSLTFVVDDQQLEMMRTRGLKYRLRQEEIPAFDWITLVYKSPYPTVPLAPQMVNRDTTSFRSPATRPNPTAPSTRAPSQFSNAANPIPNAPSAPPPRRADSNRFATASDQNGDHNHEHLDNLSQFDPHPATSSPATRQPDRNWQPDPNPLPPRANDRRQSDFLDSLPERSPSSQTTGGFRPRVLDTANSPSDRQSFSDRSVGDLARQNREYEAQTARQREEDERWQWQQQMIDENRRLANERERLTRLAERLDEKLAQFQPPSNHPTQFGTAPDDSRAPIEHPTYQYPPRRENDFRLADRRLSQTTGAATPPRRNPVAPVTTGPWPNAINGPQASPNNADSPVATSDLLAQLFKKYGFANTAELESFLENNSELLAKTEKMEQLKKTNGFLWFMLLCAIGLAIYLSWIARGFYVRYAELADELRETFTSSLS